MLNYRRPSKTMSAWVISMAHFLCI